MCSASIIAEDAVITAAICLGAIPELKPEEVSVVAGNIDRMQGASVKAKTIKIHPLFRYYPLQTVLEHDIAIILLSEPFKVDGQNISKIKLIEKSKAKTDLTNKEGVVAGWGAVAMQNKLLQYVNVTISNQTACKNYYKQLLPVPYNLDHYQMCSEATEDLCIGESGAGLRVILDADDAPTLVGVAEPSADCPHPKRPEIYTRISEYLDWINQSLANP
ncbi:trypsin Tyr p 3.0101-like [Neocloeon triangulifer]|uniref:trypsin Tyr p 3.0101-like n=1 Tax=Neocloeon triangulifer TaxID=2078957 RepID=UPI00286EFDA8|nr:trypsin Tyr p 3.0101-like [Neocloeon triangulifer]